MCRSGYNYHGGNKMKCNKDLGLIKVGIWILLVGCTIGVSVAAHAANGALGERTISPFQWQSSSQEWHFRVLGWQKQLQLPSGEVIRHQSSELITAGAKAFGKQVPVVREKMTEQLSVLQDNWTKHRETAVSYFRSTIEQWEKEPSQQ